MPSRIDDKTMVPLGIVAALFVVGISVTATGAFWVSRVDDRLALIEKRLGIADNIKPHGVLEEAQAGTR